MLTIRPATPTDVPLLATLLEEYMRELFHCAWNGSREALARDGFGRHFDAMVAAHDEALVGFAAWTDAYDLHNGIPGAEIVDLYVRANRRGRGVALQLVAAVAAAVQARGGAYVKGLAVGDPATRRGYERLAVAFPGADCIVGGRAFRTLAGLAGKSARAMVRGLPDKAANFEP